MQNRSIKYLLCFMGSVLLLAIAILGPQLLFNLQDEYRMEKSWQGQRLSLDIEALNSSYGSMRERLLGFADGLAQGKNYYVAGTEYKVTEDTYALVEEILGQEIFSFLNEWGLLVYPLQEWYRSEVFNVRECKKYVVYDDSFEEGQTSFVIMAWYMEIKIFDNFYIKILTDTETNALYYIQCVREGDESEESYAGAGKKEEMWYYLEMTEMLFSYCYYYYGAGTDKAQSYEEFVKNMDGEKYVESILRETYYDGEIGAKAMLPYGENGNFLILDMGVKSVDDIRKEEQIYLGIIELKEIIPEFGITVG